MDVDSLLAELSQPGLPEAALAAAMAERETVAPALAARLDEYLTSRRPGDEPPQWLFFAVHLLGSMRWSPAYRSVVRLLAGDGEAVNAALDDAIGATASRVVYALFDGDWAPVRDAAIAADADPCIRWGMFALIGWLALDGRIPREEAVAFLRRAHDEGMLGGDAAVWHGWAEAVELLGLREFKPLIERGYAEGRLDPMFATKRETLDGIEHTAATGRPHDLLMRLEPFPEDIVAEFRTWHFDSDEPEPADGRAAPPAAWDLPQGAWDFEPAEPVRNPLRHVGRNDPCPCGSGKKFKKCCLGAA